MFLYVFQLTRCLLVKKIYHCPLIESTCLAVLSYLLALCALFNIYTHTHINIYILFILLNTYSVDTFFSADYLDHW